jgi:hypothetical protein
MQVVLHRYMFCYEWYLYRDPQDNGKIHIAYKLKSSARTEAFTLAQESRNTNLFIWLVLLF